MVTRKLLQRAFDRRSSLLRDGRTTAVRAVNSRADGLPHVTVDWFDGVAVLSLYTAFPEAHERALAEELVAGIGARSVYLKRRPREARVATKVSPERVAPPMPWAGAPVPELVAKENGLSFRIRPSEGLAVGLYLDMRETRQWLRSRLRGRSVLNCFAYTCAFGMYAHDGGASRVVNVDLSRRVLDWGEENLRLNGGVPDRRDHLAGDAFEWLRRFARKGDRFDVVILDPPSFSTSKGGVFSAKRDYSKLVAAAAPVVSEAGWLVACCNLEDLPGERFNAQIRRGLNSAGRPGRVLERLGPSPIDFPPHREEPPALKVRVLELDPPTRPSIAQRT
jgi:23S rRNA (cytosine1962-C5)-methyltransferase